MQQKEMKRMQEAFVEKFDAKVEKYAKSRQCINEVFDLLSRNTHLVLCQHIYINDCWLGEGKYVEELLGDDDVVIGININQDYYHKVIGFFKNMLGFVYKKELNITIDHRLWEVDELFVSKKVMMNVFNNLNKDNITSETITETIKGYFSKCKERFLLSSNEIDVIKGDIIENILKFLFLDYSMPYNKIPGKAEVMKVFFQNYLGTKFNGHDKLEITGLSEEFSRILAMTFGSRI